MLSRAILQCSKQGRYMLWKLRTGKGPETLWIFCTWRIKASRWRRTLKELHSRISRALSCCSHSNLLCLLHTWWSGRGWELYIRPVESCHVCRSRLASNERILDPELCFLCAMSKKKVCSLVFARSVDFLFCPCCNNREITSLSFVTFDFQSERWLAQMSLVCFSWHLLEFRATDPSWHCSASEFLL